MDIVDRNYSEEAFDPHYNCITVFPFELAIRFESISIGLSLVEEITYPLIDGKVIEVQFDEGFEATETLFCNA